MYMWHALHESFLILNVLMLISLYIICLEKRYDICKHQLKFMPYVVCHVMCRMSYVYANLAEEVTITITDAAEWRPPG